MEAVREGREGASDVRWSAHPADIDYIRTNVPCRWACPALTDVPEYIRAIDANDPGRCYAINRRSNLLPGVLGRICSKPCEAACRHGEPDLGAPVSICHLKRAGADGKGGGFRFEERLFARTGKSVGIVGMGPAGIAAAHSLAVFGHRVVLYDAMPAPGGMLRYGIPAFRLPRAVIDEEVGNALRLGVETVYNTRLGADVTAAELRARHDALVIATGCYDSYKLNLRGADLPQVFSGLGFMMQLNQGRTPALGARVAVIGGGFTAFDCARIARRLGAEDVAIYVLTTEEDLVVAREEIIEAKREGVRIVALVASTEILGARQVEGVRFVRNRIARDRLKGRRVAMPIEGSDFTAGADAVIAAIGQKPERALAWKGLASDPALDARTGATDAAGIFAAGDFVSGASTVIAAIGHGRRVAAAVDAYLIGAPRRRSMVAISPARDTHRVRAWDFIPRAHMPVLPIEQRLARFDVEVETGLTPELSCEEARRCYLCNLKYEISVPGCIFCRWCMEVCPRECIHLVAGIGGAADGARGELLTTGRWHEVRAVVIDNDRCIRCGECLRICPTRCIGVRRTDLVEVEGAEEQTHG